MKFLATALALAASPALADINPEELLESWHKAFDRVQIDLTIGSQAFEGDILVLRDVQLTKRNPLSRTPPSIDWVRLLPLPGGAVSIALSSTENTAQPHYDGLDITATGSPEKITYYLNAGMFSFDQQHKSTPIITDTALAVTDLSLFYSQWEDATGHFRSEGQFSAGSVVFEWSETIDLAGDPTDGNVIQRGKLSLTELSMPFDMTAPAEYFTDLSRAVQGLPEGLTMDMQLLATQAALQINGGDLDPDFTLDISMSDSETTINIGNTNLHYLFDFSQIAVASHSPLHPNQLLTLGMDQLFLDLSMPFRKSAVAAPFALATRLENLEMAPAAWDIFDPNSVMARVPASLDLHVSGEATLLVDLFTNPEKVNARSGSPIQLHSLSLDRLDIRAENAMLTGEGRVDIDNNTMDKITGQPEATGSLNFAITGALALLDRVGSLPNMDPMMALGAKGALGMFATPTTEADSFTSRVDFTNGGHISVNGQQVK